MDICSTDSCRAPTPGYCVTDQLMLLAPVPQPAFFLGHWRFYKSSPSYVPLENHHRFSELFRRCPKGTSCLLMIEGARVLGNWELIASWLFVPRGSFPLFFVKYNFEATPVLKATFSIHCVRLSGSVKLTRSCFFFAQLSFGTNTFTDILDFTSQCLTMLSDMWARPRGLINLIHRLFHCLYTWTDSFWRIWTRHQIPISLDMLLPDLLQKGLWYAQINV